MHQHRCGTGRPSTVRNLVSRHNVFLGGTMAKRLLTVLMVLTLAGLMTSNSWAARSRHHPDKEVIGHARVPFLAPQAGGCVEVDVELLPGNNDATSILSTEVTNCGDDAAMLSIDITLNLNGLELGPFTHHLHLGAGESLVRSIRLATNLPIPAGDYTLCVKASVGEDSDEDCATLNVAAPTRIVLDTYPNPFNADTRVTYRLSRDSHVRLDVLDILGRKVVTLVDNHAAAGVYSHIWNGKGQSGRTVASGTYFMRLTTADGSTVKSMTLLK